MDRNFSAERPFSFRHQFADQWYDLHNPAQTETPMTVSFTTTRQDFPSNIEEIKIQHIVLYFAFKDGASFEPAVNVNLFFTPDGEDSAAGGEANPVDDIISTRQGNGDSWQVMLGKTPAGEWELELPDTDDIKSLFKEEKIKDILFVITYSGLTPPWPQ